MLLNIFIFAQVTTNIALLNLFLNNSLRNKETKHFR